MSIENIITITWDEIELMHPDACDGSVFYYQGKPFTGLLVEYHANGNLISEIEVFNSHTHGRIREFHINGMLKEEYYKKFNRFYGFYKMWDENGNLISTKDFGPEPDIQF